MYEKFPGTPPFFIHFKGWGMIHERSHAPQNPYVFRKKKRRTFASLVEFQGTLTFSAREKNIKTSPGFW
jgi:hypothetical protein